MKTLLILLALAATLTARPVKLRWNPNPPDDNVTEYRVFRGLEELGRINGTTITVEANTGDVLHVIAANAYGISEPSDPVTVPALPTNPTGLEVVEIQVSSNLTDWETIALVPSRTKDAVRFVRAGITTIDTPAN